MFYYNAAAAVGVRAAHCQTLHGVPQPSSVPETVISEKPERKSAKTSLECGQAQDTEVHRKREEKNDQIQDDHVDHLLH